MNLTALISKLHDPNVAKLADSLGKANFTDLANVLGQPTVDLEHLMSALRQYNLFDEGKVGVSYSA